MSVTTEELSQLMHETYETAAVKHGWHTNDRSRVSWAFVPEENKAAMRDAVAYVERVVREDERAKHGQDAIQSDLRQILEVLDLGTYTRSYSSHEVVQKEILPKIRKMKNTLVQVREAFARNFVEVKDILDEGRNL